MVKDHPELNIVRVDEVLVLSGVLTQPFPLKETIRRTEDIASKAYKASPCKYGISIENGLMEAPTTEGGFSYIFVCSLFDGNQYYIGLSTGIEVPAKIITFMRDKDASFNREFLESDMLINGKIDRKSYLQQAIKNAITQLKYGVSNLAP